jgi:ABC-2 type transport system permease protein
MVGAFAYLTVTSARNRVRRQLGRLRSPRYVLAMLFAVGYFALIFSSSLRGQQAPAGFLLHVDVLALASLAGLALVIYWWVLGKDTGALAFSPAEVQFLFPAPVTRRQLVELKLVRAQVVILLNIVIWTLLLGRGRGAGEMIWLRPLSLWVLFSVVQLHRLGATLSRTSLSQHGAAGLRRSGAAIAIVAVLTAVVLAGLARAWPTGGLAEPRQALDWLAAGVAWRPAAWALLPVRAVLAPLFAATPAEWVRVIGPAVAIMLVHFAWVVRTDAAFEEAAAQATAERAQRAARRRGAGSASAPKGWRRGLPLAPVGEPAVAIVWKNVLAVMRAQQFGRQMLMLAVAAVALIAFASFRPSQVGFASGILIAWIAMMLVMGPMWLRQDLRADLLRLEVMRTYPVEPARFVGAQIASSALVLSVLEAVFGALLLFLFLRAPEPPLPPAQLVAYFTAGFLALPVVNAIGAGIHNAGALLFPAWISLGPDRKPGFEQMGQVYLTLFLSILLLAVLLVVPALAGALTVFALGGTYGPWSAIPAVLVGGAVAMGEVVLLVRQLGRVFARTEPSDVTA